jgi:putative ABC transport system permease protein
LALANLYFQPVRTAISIGGVAFAVLLMLMQLGFLDTVKSTATIMYDRLPFDVAIRSTEYLNLFESRTIPESLQKVIYGTAGVSEVRMLDFTIGTWRNPNTGEFRGIAVWGIDPQLSAIDLPELQEQLDVLAVPNTALIDRSSRKEFGPANGAEFGDADLDREAELLARRVTIRGHYLLGTGLAANGAVILSRDTFAALVPPQRNQTNLLLVRGQPGSDPQALAVAIQQRIDACGYHELAIASPRAEVIEWEKSHWIWHTPVGLIFLSGVVLAVVVGAMVCYMVLSADVMGKLPEYATLKAMGYQDRFLAQVILEQAWYLALAAFCLTVPVALLVYKITSDYSGIPIVMTYPRLIYVVCLTLLACSLAGLAALRKLTRAEPASLF